jgi:hypothetical protein
VCNYVIARNPTNQPTSERAIPVAIFRRAQCAVPAGSSGEWSGVPLAVSEGGEAAKGLQQQRLWQQTPAPRCCRPAIAC